MDGSRFDAIIATLATHPNRRALLSILGASALAWFNIGDFAPDEAEAKKRRHKKPKHKKPHHKKRKRPHKGKPKAGSCSDGACAAVPEWAGDEDQINYCELICQQCDGDDPRDFCIRGGTKPDGTATKVADCCKLGEECCGGFCCPNNDFYRCCDGKCVNISLSLNHCGGCDKPCTGGRSCVDGGCRCLDGQIDCDGVCVAGAECPNDGGDDCSDGRPRCNGGCCPSGQKCFGDQQCCPDSYIDPICPNEQSSNVCVPDGPFVCCDGHSHRIAPPEDYWCCGVGPNGTVLLADAARTVSTCYPPLSIHQPA